MLYNELIFKRHFPYRGRYFIKNITGIIPYFKAIHFLIKNGYDEYAVWETDRHFIITTQSILEKYRDTRSGTPILVENYPHYEPKTDDEKRIVNENEELWNSVINRMIELLELMDERNSVYDNMEYTDSFSKMTAAKDEFFELFSKYFYHLWD